MLQRKQHFKSRSKQPCARTKGRKEASPMRIHKVNTREIRCPRRNEGIGNENNSVSFQRSTDTHRILLSEAAKLQISCMSKVVLRFT